MKIIRSHSTLNLWGFTILSTDVSNEQQRVDDLYHFDRSMNFVN